MHHEREIATEPRRLDLVPDIIAEEVYRDTARKHEQYLMKAGIVYQKQE